MVKFIKCTIQSVEKNDTLMLDSLVTFIACDMQSGITRGFSDLIKLAKMFKSEMKIMNVIPGKMTVIDYAEVYQKLGGNSILFLKYYQNYIGQIQ